MKGTVYYELSDIEDRCTESEREEMSTVWMLLCCCRLIYGKIAGPGFNSQLSAESHQEVVVRLDVTQ